MTGEKSDRDSVIEEYHYLCARAARKFVRETSDRADLEQVAAIGLIKAVDRFDGAVGTPFEAFAWVFILGELMHYVRDAERALRVPRRIRDLARRWSAVERDLTDALGCHPSSREIARAMHLDRDDEAEVLRYRDASAVISVEALHGYEQGSLSYTIDAQVDRWMLESAMSVLTPLERQIVVAIYEHDIPIVTLAQSLGYSRRHITRMHRAALEKLRLPVGA
jgi:RNA polymerase sigma-B factor